MAFPSLDRLGAAARARGWAYCFGHCDSIAKSYRSQLFNSIGLPYRFWLCDSIGLPYRSRPPDSIQSATGASR